MAEELELTPQHKVILEETKLYWLDKIFKPGPPDEDRLRTGTKWLYNFSQLAEPEVYLVASPLAAQYAANILDRDEIKEWAGDRLCHLVLSQCSRTWAENNTISTGEINSAVAQALTSVMGFAVSIGHKNLARLADLKERICNSRVNGSGNLIKLAIDLMAFFLTLKEDDLNRVLGTVNYSSPKVFVQSALNVFCQFYRQKALFANYKQDVIDKGIARRIKTMFTDEQALRNLVVTLLENIAPGLVGTAPRAIPDIEIQKVTMTYYQYSVHGNVSNLSWTAYNDFYKRAGLLDYEPFDRFKELMEAGPYDMLQFDEVAIVSAMPPRIRQDLEYRMHSEDGMAIQWLDGFGYYYLSGVVFDEPYFWGIINHTMTAQEVMREVNLEKKSVAMRYYGWNNILKDMNARTLGTATWTQHHPQKGDIPSIYEVMECDLGDEPTQGTWARFLKVTCPSTGHEHILRVDPTNDATRDPIGAVASTFRMTKEQYKPLLEA